MTEVVQLNIINVLTGSAVQIQVTTDTSLGDIRDRLVSLYELSPEAPAQLQLLCAGYHAVDMCPPLATPRAPSRFQIRLTFLQHHHHHHDHHHHHHHHHP